MICRYQVKSSDENRAQADATYHMNGRVFEFVLLFVVEDEAVLLYVAHYRRLPPWTLQEGDQTIENPILYT